MSLQVDRLMYSTAIEGFIVLMWSYVGLLGGGWVVLVCAAA